MKSIVGPAIKGTVFVAVTSLATAVLALTIMNGSSSGGHHFDAVFSDVTSLNLGDDVRMAGVRIGQVSSIKIVRRRAAEVGFSVQSDVRLAPTVTATIRYRNLIGQRYLALDEGTGSLDHPLPSGSVIPLARTSPALDLTDLFNGFQPLFQALAPKQINELSAEVIEVFQGEGPTVSDLLTQTASLTSTLASKDEVIGEVIDNLTAVLQVVNSHGGQLTDLITTLQQFVSGLAQDRGALGDAISGIAGLTSEVGGLLKGGRTSIHADITALGALSTNLADSSDALNSFLRTLPGKLSTIGRTASYGSWLNFYLCSVAGRIPVPSGYSGGVGVQPVASRCAS
jgi:phospholipid/cholesterol/gamma-HCH transport system substrate-binding protein